MKCGILRLAIILLKLDANQEKLENKEIEKLIKLFNYEIEIE